MTPKAKVLTDAERAVYQTRIEVLEAENRHLRDSLADLGVSVTDLETERHHLVTHSADQSARRRALLEERIGLRATIDALKAELALKDKVVEAARLLIDETVWSEEWGTAETMTEDISRLVAALNDLDKVIAR